MSPILIPDEVVFNETKAEGFSKRSPKVAMIDFRGKYGHRVCSTEKMIRMLIKIPKHRYCRNKGKAYENNRMLPIELKKMLVRKD